MYETYWGLAESPFHNRIDDRWFYRSPMHEEALARLYYLIEQRRSFGILAGPPGTGKSLLLDILHREIGRTGRRVALLDSAGLGGDELLWQLAATLNLAPAVNDSRLALWRSVDDHLAGLMRARLPIALVFDHLDRAQPDCALILARLLQRPQGTANWMTVIVATRNDRDGSAQPGSGTSGLLSESADLRIGLTPLTADETNRYVEELLKRAGCRRRIFTPEVLANLHRLTRGLPRAVNRLCDLALLAGMSEERSTIDATLLAAAAHHAG